MGNEVLLKREYQKQILLAESYKLGLHVNSVEIVNKFIAKMQIILNATGISTEPTQKELLKYYKDNQDDYSFKKNKM